MIESRLEGTGIRVLNWFKRAHNFGDDENLNQRVYKTDAFHLSHAGIREVVQTWISMIPDLRFVGYTLKKSGRFVAE